MNILVDKYPDRGVGNPVVGKLPVHEINRYCKERGQSKVYWKLAHGRNGEYRLLLVVER